VNSPILLETLDCPDLEQMRGLNHWSVVEATVEGRIFLLTDVGCFATVNLFVHHLVTGRELEVDCSCVHFTSVCRCDDSLFEDFTVVEICCSAVYTLSGTTDWSGFPLTQPGVECFLLPFQSCSRPVN
jgi:hypothetical protein